MRKVDKEQKNLLKYSIILTLFLCVVLLFLFFVTLDKSLRHQRIIKALQAIDDYLPVELADPYYDIISQHNNWNISPIKRLKNGLNAKIPELHFSIEYEDLKILESDRNKMIKNNSGIGLDRQEVPAKLSINNKNVKAKIRIKGQEIDHVEGNRWSLKVKLKKNNTLGMKVFSLQAPHTRGYHLEAILHDYLQKNNFTSPRYKFVKMRANRKPVGIMAMEEHLSGNILEHFDKPESIIFRFKKDDMLKNTRLGFRQDDLWQVLPLEFYNKKRISKNSTLKSYRQKASELMRKFALHEINPSEIFDAEHTGKLLAILDVFQAWHALNSDDLRFYYNPTTSKIELIPYDMMLGFSGAPYSLLHYKTRLLFVSHLLEDKKIRDEYLKEIETLTNKKGQEEIWNFVQEREEYYLNQLGSEFPMIPKLDKDFFNKRLTMLRNTHKTYAEPEIQTLIADKLKPHNIQTDKPYPPYVYSYIIDKPDGKYLELISSMDHMVIIEELMVNGKDLDGVEMPLELLANLYNKPLELTKIKLPEAEKYKISGIAKMARNAQDQELNISYSSKN